MHNAAPVETHPMTDPYLDAETLYERWATELARTDREPDAALIASIEAVAEQHGYSMVEFAKHKAGELQPLVAARRAWNPDLHPRGRDGKFIVKFGFITGLFSLLDKKGGKKEGRGRVLDIKPDPKSPGNPDIHVEVINRNGKVVGTEVVKADTVKAAPVSKARLNTLDDAERLETEGVPGRMRNLERDVGAPDSLEGVDLDAVEKTDPSELQVGDVFKRRVKLPPDADGNRRTGEAFFRVTDTPTKGPEDTDPYSIPSELVAVHGDDGVWVDELIAPDGSRLTPGDTTELPAGHLGGEQGHVQVDKVPVTDRSGAGGDEFNADNPRPGSVAQIEAEIRELEREEAARNRGVPDDVDIPESPELQDARQRLLDLEDESLTGNDGNDYFKVDGEWQDEFGNPVDDPVALELEDAPDGDGSGGAPDDPAYQQHVGGRAEMGLTDVDVPEGPGVDGDAVRAAIDEVESSMEIDDVEDPGFREEWMGRLALAYEDLTGEVLTNQQLEEITDAEIGRIEELGTDAPVDDDDQAVIDYVLDNISEYGAGYVFNPGENENAMLKQVHRALDEYLKGEDLELSDDERDALVDEIVRQGREKRELMVRGRPEDWEAEKNRIAASQKEGAKLKKNDLFVGPDGNVYIVNRKQNGQVIAERAVDDQIIDGEMFVRDPSTQRDVKRFDYADIVPGGPGGGAGAPDMAEPPRFREPTADERAGIGVQGPDDELIDRVSDDIAADLDVSELPDDLDPETFDVNDPRLSDTVRDVLERIEEARDRGEQIAGSEGDSIIGQAIEKALRKKRDSDGGAGAPDVAKGSPEPPDAGDDFTPRNWARTWVSASELDEHLAGLTPEQRAAEFNANFGAPRAPSPRSRLKKLDDAGLKATFDALGDETPDDLRREFKIELARRGLIEPEDTAAAELDLPGGAPT